jgi:hypothetical protein
MLKVLFLCTRWAYLSAVNSMMHCCMLLAMTCAASPCCVSALHRRVWQAGEVFGRAPWRLTHGVRSTVAVVESDNQSTHLFVYIRKVSWGSAVDGVQTDLEGF